MRAFIYWTTLVPALLDFVNGAPAHAAAIAALGLLNYVYWTTGDPQ